MTPAILMIGGAIALVIGVGIVIANFVSFFKAPSFENSFEEMAGDMQRRVTTHLICGALATLGLLSLFGGFFWFLVERSNQ